MQRSRLDLNYLILALALIGLVAGAYFTFFESRGFVKTKAVIVSVKEISDPSSDSGTTRRAEVEYEANGKTYRQFLDAYSPSYKVGKTVNITYDPADPMRIHGGSWMGIYFMGIGAVLFFGTIIAAVRKKKAVDALKDLHPESLVYDPSVQGEERKLYFLTERGTWKFGHRIEDASRRVLYEAKVTKFHFSVPVEFDFIDHEHLKTAPHLVGQVTETSYDSLLTDDHSTFSFDGEDIWAHLKRNGIRVESSFMPDKKLFVQYRIFREGKEIGLAETTGVYPHEDDAAAHGKISSRIPAKGYYHIHTREQNLDLLFLTLMAFARTSAHDDTGGSYGLFLKKERK